MTAHRADYHPPLPLVPEAILRHHRVHEPSDHRFRACARLLQALWREEQDLPSGCRTAPDGRVRPLGSMLGLHAAQSGRNFLNPAIARLARREVIYQEPGAMIDRRRLQANLLSSMPLAFNLFGTLRLDLDLAARVLRAIMPAIDLARVVHVLFEHSPGRLCAELTADRTAFDAAFVYERSDGQRGLIAIEQKYSEGHGPSAPDSGSSLTVLAERSGLYREPASAVLRTGACEQLFREHLLAYAAKERGDYAEAHFLLVAPRHNHLIQQGAALYASHLAGRDEGPVPFINVELERFIEAIAWAGDFDHAQLLYDRYCNWLKLDLVIDRMLETESGRWGVAPRRRGKVIALPGRAA